MKRFEGKKWLGRVVVLVVLGVGAAACSTTSAAKNGTAEPRPPIEAESPQVRQAFEEAVQLMEDGRWDEARDAFRLLQSEHSGDPIAVVAELYAARAMLRDLDGQFAGEDQELDRPVATYDPQALPQLESLARSNTIDDRIRLAARLYLAVARVLDGDLQDSLQGLADYPGPSLGPVVLDFDHRWVWPLVAEALARAGRNVDSALAWGNFHQLLVELHEAELDELDGEGQPRERWFADESISPEADLAMARAFDVAEELQKEEVRDFLHHELALVRAVGLWTFVRRSIEAPLGPEAIEALQALFNDISPAFLKIGAADRASELSAAIAGVSGVERLVIGALLPLSGSDRGVGYRALAGMLVAQRAFHVAGEPAVTLLIEDSHGDPVAAYERLVDQGALAVVGPMVTAEAHRLVEYVERHGVPMIALTADRLSVEEHRAQLPSEDDDSLGAEDREVIELPEQPPVFRNFVDAIAEARAAAVVSFDRLGDRRAAVVHPDMGYGRVMARHFVEEFRRQGGEVILELSYDRDATDYSDLASQVARARPDAIFVPDTGAKVAEVTAFFAQEQIWGVHPDHTRRGDSRIYVQYLGTSLWQESILLHQAASYVEGALIPAWYSPVFSDPDSRQFTQGYEAIYGGQADHFVAFAYDSVNRLRTLLLERGVVSTSDMANALRHGEMQRGATGRFYFGDDGESRRELRYLTVDDGQWAVFEQTVMTPVEGRTDAGDDQRSSPDDGAGGL